MTSKIIIVNGQRYDITNWDEFVTKILTNIGIMVQREIEAEIDKMRLVDTGAFKLSAGAETSRIIKGNELILTNNEPYAQYLEYGTFEYFDRFGMNSIPSGVDPKKKNITAKQRKKFPKGMQPFAPYRRVLWNKNKMGNIINKALKFQL